ncbi:CvfB family protein [Liquorilactobacillus sicerae]|uniref:CvfB family protein n=1 Tax=Liquorilactobacillus sicerae TaxID=1416943 RepID=UPI0024816166|nr:S1-like domain-containing RNA-binding protein [Liquorilactobacillus sicerae]
MVSNLIGQIVIAKMIDQNQDSYFVQAQAQTLRVAKQELTVALKKGAEIRGLVYENEKHQLQMTTQIPQVGVGRYAFGKVVSVKRDLGVFVDIGLENKDIAVSLDELPELHQLWPKTGDQLMIALKVDQKGRLWGTLATTEIFQQISVKALPAMMNQDVEATVYRLKLAGTLVITRDFYLGFIHPTQRDQEPRLGEILKARVIGVRPDGILNLSLKPRAYEAIGDDAAMLLSVLQHQNGVLPFSDQSSPQEINEHFGISKGRFKRAIGHLMKNGLVTEKDGKLFLKA